MKKIYILFICFICLITTGCFRTYLKDDVMKKYSDYWEYSLGEYTYTTRDTDNGGDPGGFSKTFYKEFVVNFKDSKSQDRTIWLTNNFLGTYDGFNKEIISVANRYIDDEVKKIIKNNTAIKQDGININDSYLLSLKMKDNSINLYDSKKGVRFKDLSIQTLDNNNLTLTIKFYVTLSKTMDNYPNLNDILISYVKDLYSLNKNIKTVFTINEGNNQSQKILNLTYFKSHYVWEYEK